MSNKGVFWGKSEKEVKKEKREEKAASLDEVLATVTTKSYNPTYKAYCIIKLGVKDYRVVEVGVDISELSSLQTRGTVLPSVYDSEPRAILEMNKLLLEQSKQMRK